MQGERLTGGYTMPARRVVAKPITRTGQGAWLADLRRQLEPPLSWLILVARHCTRLNPSTTMDERGWTRHVATAGGALQTSQACRVSLVFLRWEITIIAVDSNRRGEKQHMCIESSVVSYGRPYLICNFTANMRIGYWNIAERISVRYYSNMCFGAM